MKTIYRILWVISMIINAFFIGFALMIGLVFFLVSIDDKPKNSYSKYNYSDFNSYRSKKGRD